MNARSVPPSQFGQAVSSLSGIALTNCATFSLLYVGLVGNPLAFAVAFVVAIAIVRLMTLIVLETYCHEARQAVRGLGTAAISAKLTRTTLSSLIDISALKNVRVAERDIAIFSLSQADSASDPPMEFRAYLQPPGGDFPSVVLLPALTTGSLAVSRFLVLHELGHLQTIQHYALFFWRGAERRLMLTYIVLIVLAPDAFAAVILFALYLASVFVERGHDVEKCADRFAWISYYRMYGKEGLQDALRRVRVLFELNSEDSTLEKVKTEEYRNRANEIAAIERQVLDGRFAQMFREQGRESWWYLGEEKQPENRTFADRTNLLIVLSVLTFWMSALCLPSTFESSDGPVRVGLLMFVLLGYALYLSWPLHDVIERLNTAVWQLSNSLTFATTETFTGPIFGPGESMASVLVASNSNEEARDTSRWWWWRR